MQGRNPYNSMKVDGIYLTGGVQACVGTLVNHYALLLISSGSLLAGQLVEYDGNDQVSLGQIIHVNRYLYALDVQKPFHLIGSMKQSVKQSSLMKHDSGHTFYIQLSSVLGILKLLADPAYIVHNSAEHCVHAGGAAAHLPVALLLFDQLSVRQVHDTLGQPAYSQASCAAEFVGSEVYAVQSPGLHIGQSVRRMLYGVADDVQVGFNLSGLSGDGLDIQNSAGDVGGHDHA